MTLWVSKITVKKEKRVKYSKIYKISELRSSLTTIHNNVVLTQDNLHSSFILKKFTLSIADVFRKIHFLPHT